MMVSEDSLKKRYFFKLTSKLIGIPIGFISAAIVPRGLGVVAYGDFSFITNFFMRLTAFIDAGTSTALYTKLSQRPNESSLLRFYWGLFALITLFILLLLCAIFLINMQGIIWINQQTKFIWFGFLWGLLYWLNQIIHKIVDAYGVTVRSEIAVIKQRIIGLCLLVILFMSNKISLQTIFIYHFTILLVMIYLWWRILKSSSIDLYPAKRLSKIRIKRYSNEFYKFSMPLFIGGIVAFVFGFAGRWLLQIFGGSVEQGLFSLSLKISALCFLFTKSITPLFHREIAKASWGGDREKMRIHFLRFIPMFYSVATCISTFFFFQANKISLILGGYSFKAAAVPVALMSLYPIHQTYGQLNSAVYFATGRTKLYRNLGLINSSLGLIITFFFLAPEQYMGLNLGSTGLALEMILVQFIGQNILLWYNTKLLEISYIKLLGHQIILIVIFGVVAGLTTMISNLYINNILVNLITAGAIYLVIALLIVYLLPAMVSSSRNEIKRNMRLIFQKLSRSS